MPTRTGLEAEIESGLPWLGSGARAQISLDLSSLQDETAGGEILVDFSRAFESGSSDGGQGPMPEATGKIYLVKRILIL